MKERQREREIDRRRRNRVRNRVVQRKEEVRHRIRISFSAIVSALSGSGCEVYLDGGIRMGTDVLKALALGAK